MATQISKMQKRLSTPKDERKPLGSEMKPNNFWDQLADTDSQLLGASHAMGQQVVERVSLLLADSEKKALIKDQAQMTAAINLINKDIADHHAKLAQIKEKHAGKTGGTVEPDEHMSMLHIHGEYVQESELFNAAILSSAKNLSDLIDKVEEEYKIFKSEQKQVNDLIDPTVITDVEFKHVQ